MIYVTIACFCVSGAVSTYLWHQGDRGITLGINLAATVLNGGVIVYSASQMFQG
jgi:hypothetical protein